MFSAMRWMAKNSVAANIAMAVLLFGGLLFAPSIKQEIFPEFQLDLVNIAVPYSGAGPEEVEQGICLPVEEAISGIEGIKETSCIAYEGAGLVTAELLSSSNVDAVVQDIKSEVDGIRTFPKEAEEPKVSKVVPRHEVLSIAVFGEASQKSLREMAESIRDDLLEYPEITQIELSGVAPYEISVEITEENLRKYRLSLDTIAERIRQGYVDLPAGVVKEAGGEILLRTRDKRDYGADYESIRVVSTPAGAEVRLGDIAKVLDEFEDVDERGFFDGKPAAMLRVFRVGEQAPIEISEIVRDYVAKKRHGLSGNIDIGIWDDRSELLKSRLELLLKNAYIGLVLVFVVLGLFLELKLAFWVTMGIPVSFLGTMLFLPGLDISINMVSLFAFILCLGIVVDDAIVVGENIYEHRLSGKSLTDSAVDGVIEVAMPVAFSTLTTISAFFPMLFISGTMGKFVWVIPAIVITVLSISLFECFFILPSHLAHSAHLALGGSSLGRIERSRQEFGRKVDIFVENVFKPIASKAVQNRVFTLSIAASFLLFSFGLLFGGLVKFINLPPSDGEIVSVSVEMPVGTTAANTSGVVKRIQDSALIVASEFDDLAIDGYKSLRNIFATVGKSQEVGPHGGGFLRSGGHIAGVTAFLASSDNRHFRASDFAKNWRERVGEIPGVKSLVFSSDFANPEDDIDIRLEHEDLSILRQASERLLGALRQFAGVRDARDNFALGTRELKFKLLPRGRMLGLTEAELAKQVRAGYFGAEALRIQRGRNELKVMVRYSKEERDRLSSLENMRIRLSDGAEVPLVEVVQVSESEGYSEIRRSNRKRIVNVSALVDYSMANPDQIISVLQSGVLKDLMLDYPGLSSSLSGTEQDRRESNASLLRGFVFALALIYAQLAIVFRHYMQPLVVMFAIPFAFAGAVLAHFILGHDISLLSMCGFVALAGVVVNDSLVLIDFVNSLRREGMGLSEALITSACRRFKPIILTSLTTFFGLVPLIFETSFQAQFLVPMAISLGFGVVFGTFVTLLVVPAFYVVLDRGSAVK
ncbi:MAG: efflux RND transporter permease subunit [Deltaproteobacteria bacterium]|nr:efflux RND transporter permease subunit [Deltaproteobacteria bacterium]